MTSGRSVLRKSPDAYEEWGEIVEDANEAGPVAKVAHRCSLGCITG